MKAALAIAFFATAALYASVGFGGGSTYTALLAVSGISFALVPVISLICNIAVVSSNTVRFSRARLVPWRKLVPLLCVSIPAAWLGGRMVVSETVFLGLLWIALLLAGTRLLLGASPRDADPAPSHPLLGTGIGAGVGFYSGIVGIGGGIFLAPLLHQLRWDRPHRIAAACSVFILVNSASGLLGQLQKLADGGGESGAVLADVLAFWPLLAAVVVGGTLGNRISIAWLKPRQLRRLTGFLVVMVALRLAWRWASLVGLA